MKLDLRYPYEPDFKIGYCYKNSESRRVVALIRKDGSRTFTSYARYLMSCEVGRYLNDDEHADHIIEDPLDDRIENLQILTPKENHKKSNRRHFAEIRCPICHKTFVVSYRQTFMQKKVKNYQTCSKSCGRDPEVLEEDCEVIRDFWD